MRPSYLRLGRLFRRALLPTTLKIDDLTQTRATTKRVQ